MKYINLRPHHLTCTFCFRGDGYSPEFIENLYTITRELKNLDDPDIKIKIVDHLDEVCSTCPHVVENHCDTPELVAELDENHAKILKIKVGDVLTCQEVREKVRQLMTLEKFHQACTKCPWHDKGVCADIIKNK